MADDLCHCGQPLHYTNPHLRNMIETLVAIAGETIPVTRLSDGRTWLVPRHYIALHGIKESKLDTYGFQEVSK